MTKEQHVHKLRRHTYKTGSAVYFCTMPDCKFKIITSLSLGKRSICWRCGEPFIMNEYSIRLAKPHCEKCHKPKSSHEDKDIITLQVPVLPTKEDIMEAIRTQSSARDLRSRLIGVIHSNLAGQPDNEEDI